MFYSKCCLVSVTLFFNHSQTVNSRMIGRFQFGGNALQFFAKMNLTFFRERAKGKRVRETDRISIFGQVAHTTLLSPKTSWSNHFPSIIRGSNFRDNTAYAAQVSLRYITTVSDEMKILRLTFFRRNSSFSFRGWYLEPRICYSPVIDLLNSLKFLPRTKATRQEFESRGICIFKVDHFHFLSVTHCHTYVYV